MRQQARDKSGILVVGEHDRGVAPFGDGMQDCVKVAAPACPLEAPKVVRWARAVGLIGVNPVLVTVADYCPYPPAARLEHVQLYAAPVD